MTIINTSGLNSASFGVVKGICMALGCIAASALEADQIKPPERFGYAYDHFRLENLNGSDIDTFDINNNGIPDLIVAQHKGTGSTGYRIGWDLDGEGRVSSWSDFKPVKTMGYSSARIDSLSVQVIDLNNISGPELYIMVHDSNAVNGSSSGSYKYQVAWDLDVDGNAQNVNGIPDSIYKTPAIETDYQGGVDFAIGSIAYRSSGNDIMVMTTDGKYKVGSLENTTGEIHFWDEDFKLDFDFSDQRFRAENASRGIAIDLGEIDGREGSDVKIARATQSGAVFQYLAANIGNDGGVNTLLEYTNSPLYISEKTPNIGMALVNLAGDHQPSAIILHDTYDERQYTYISSFNVTNRIENGNFNRESKEYWKVSHPAIMNLEILNKEGCVQSSTVGDKLWYRQLRQDSVALDNDVYHFLEFDAYSDEDVKILASIKSESSGATITHAEGEHQIGKSKKRYRVRFKPREKTDDGYLFFSVGDKKDVKVCFDNVRVFEHPLPHTAGGLVSDTFSRDSFNKWFASGLGSSFSAEVSNEEACMAYDNWIRSDSWYLNYISTNNINLKSGQEYRLSYRARSFDPIGYSGLHVKIGKDGAPWTGYFETGHPVYTEKGYYDFHFTAPVDDSEAGLAFFFDAGYLSGRVCLDDIYLREM